MDIKNLFYILPVMLYYFAESAVISIFVTLVWRFFLEPIFNIHIGYFQWLGMIWIVKIIFFDVFKLLNSVMIVPPQNEINENNNQEKE